MLFRDEEEHFVMCLRDRSVDALEDLRFHLVCSSTDENRHYCTATLNKIRKLREQGYSSETISMYESALVEVLVELRVRGYEVDYSGHIFRSPVFVPVPVYFRNARRRQIERLRNIDMDHLGHLCAQTMTAAVEQARQTSKGLSLKL